MKIKGFSLTQSIEKNNGETFRALCFYVIEHRDELEFKTGKAFRYPPMKCLDMYLWEIGFELSIAKKLLGKDEQPKKDVLSKNLKLDLWKETDNDYERISRELCERNGYPFEKLKKSVEKKGGE